MLGVGLDSVQRIQVVPEEIRIVNKKMGQISIYSYF